MKLHHLVGCKAVRTKSIYVKDEDGYSEDDSYLAVNKEYITVLNISDIEITYLQHFGPSKGRNSFKFDNDYDKLFLDDNWEEWKY